MKRKAYLAVLAMSVMCLTAAGCGSPKTTENTKTTESTKEESAAEKETVEENKEDEKEENEESKESSKEDTTDTEEKETKEQEPAEYKPSRLVSVDNVEKYITIGQYKELALENTVTEITDEDVEIEIKQRLQNSAKEVSEGSVQNGDIATISYVGTLDGKAFDGGSADNYDLTIGSGTFIDGFEDGIIGMKTGETKDLNLTFDENYFESSLAGKDVVFKVTLQKFSRAPELTDEWVASETDNKTVEEYKKAVREELMESEAKTAKSTLRSSAWTTVMSSSEVKEFPQEDIDKAVSAYQDVITSYYAEPEGVSLEEYVTSQGISMEDFNEQCEQYAQSVVTQNLIIQGIMDAEGLSLESKEADAIREEMLKTYQVDNIEELVAVYGATAVDEQTGLILVEDFIVENASVEEKVSFGDTVGISGDGGDSTYYAYAEASGETVMPNGDEFPESEEVTEEEIAVEELEEDAVDNFDEDTELSEETDDFFADEDTAAGDSFED